MLEPRPRRTLVFVAVYGEERGLFGSRYHAAHPAIPLERTVAVVALDEIARNTPDTMIVVGKGFSSLGRPNDVTETPDWAKASRIVRATFYLGLDTAEQAQPPTWDAACRHLRLHDKDKR